LETQPLKRRSFWQKPIEILLFGAFSIVFGLLLAIVAVAVGSESSQFYNGNLWPLVFWVGLGMIVSGLGFLAAKSWGYVFSVLVFSLAYVASIIQAFQRDFVWGIFLDPVVLSFLLIPRIRSYFFKSQPQANVSLPLQSGVSTETGISRNVQSSPASQAKKGTLVRALHKPSNILTVILIIGIFSIIPVVAAQVHTVSVTEVSLNILYPPGSNPSNITSIWFGFSPKTVSTSMFTWGLGRMAVSFSLDNLGLFQQHTVDWISVTTPGFTLYSTGLPITVPDLASVTFHLILQAPDYDYSGPVVLNLHTT